MLNAKEKFMAKGGLGVEINVLGFLLFQIPLFFLHFYYKIEVIFS